MSTTAMSFGADLTGRTPDRVVVVGAGQAGGRCAEALRAAGFRGPITLIGKESHLPYERPSLSKEMLLEKDCEEIAWVRPAEAYVRDAIELRLGLAAVEIDRHRKRVVLEDGSHLDYGTLVLTTGARARTLDIPGAQTAWIRVLRTLEDSRALRGSLRAGSRVIVVGAGLIGLEVAAAARQRGAQVTVLDPSDRVMRRVVPAEISEHHALLHRSNGVTVELGTSLAAIRPRGESFVVESSRGDLYPADLIVAGVGVEPNDALARAAGLKTDHGIHVDMYGRTEDPDIFAAGDVARHYNPLLKRHVLLGSWQNAQNQAIAVARVIAGGGQPYAEVPWFWSDQFGVNLQAVGLPDSGLKTLLRGTPGEGPAVGLQMQDGRIVYACALNAARELRAARELIAAGFVVEESLLAQPRLPLTDLLRASRQRKVTP